jgi:Protein of unknown function (DUF3455)
MIAHRLALLSALAALAALAAVAHAQVMKPPEVPAALKAPQGEQVVLVARASGSQIYVCAAGADGKPQWTLKAPEAQLQDARGTPIGRHFAGPSWKLNDGSAVTAKVVGKSAAPEPDSIPWLLLSVVSHDGNGVLARVSSIQRIHTRGGQAPPAEKCSAAQQNVETWIPYTADYYFYAPGG